MDLSRWRPRRPCGALPDGHRLPHAFRMGAPGVLRLPGRSCWELAGSPVLRCLRDRSSHTPVVPIPVSGAPALACNLKTSAQDKQGQRAACSPFQRSNALEATSLNS